MCKKGVNHNERGCLVSFHLLLCTGGSFVAGSAVFFFPLNPFPQCYCVIYCNNIPLTIGKIFSHLLFSLFLILSIYSFCFHTCSLDVVHNSYAYAFRSRRCFRKMYAILGGFFGMLQWVRGVSLSF